MTKQRAGLTLVEIMTVMVIMGIVMMMTLPKYGNMNDRNKMRSAKDGVTSRLSAARASAVATGRPSTFTFTGTTITVTRTNTAGVEVAVGNSLDLYNQFGVKKSSGDLTIKFDGRGMTNMNAAKLIIERGLITDSLCINKLGLINRHGCLQ